MNRVSVAFEAMQRYCKISIDGEPISQYSDLAVCEGRDLHICAPKLIELLDNEICEDYIIEIKGNAFQIELLKAIGATSEYCKEVIGTETVFQFPVGEEINFLQKLISKYSLDIQLNLQVMVNGSSLLTTVPEYVEEVSDNFELLLTSTMPEQVARGYTIALIAESLEVKNVRGVNVVMLPQELLASFIEYYYTYCKLIPFVDKAISLCRFVNMHSDDKIRLSAYTEQKAKYIFRLEAEKCDLGDSIAFDFEVFPSSSADAYRMVNDTPDILRVATNKITTIGAGIGSIRILNNFGDVCETHILNVEAHSFVSSIRLVANFKYLQEGQKGKLDAYVVPENAEDAKCITWTSSNSDIVHVKSNGEVIGLKPGKARITAACQHCSEWMLVEVCPALQQIVLSNTNLAVELGKTQTITCSFIPENAAHGEIQWELDNDGLGTILVGDEGRSCRFTATTSALPKGNLKCYTKGSSKAAACAIEVVPENVPTGLMTCTLIFTILGLIFSFLIPSVWAAGGGISGYFFDIMLPVSLILSLIGKKITDNQVKVFSTCLTLNLIFTCLMFFLAIVCCN